VVSLITPEPAFATGTQALVALIGEKFRKDS
jgi:hypothetical protein